MELTIIDNKALTTELREERRRQIKTKAKAPNTLILYRNFHLLKSRYSRSIQSLNVV